MSHYANIHLRIRSATALVAALEEINPAWKGRIRVHDQAISLEGYEGRARPERANIIIARQDTGLFLGPTGAVLNHPRASNDIGFERQADGSYVAHVSEYDKSIGYNAKWLTKVTALAATHAALAKAQAQGHVVQRSVDQRGRIRLVATVGR